MPRPRLPKYCVEDQDRYGNWRVYLRRFGRKIRLKETPWTEEFKAEYAAALQSISSPTSQEDDGRPKLQPVLANTWRWLCVKFMKECAEYLNSAATTRAATKRILESTYDEPVKPGSALTYATVPVSVLNTKAVRVLRDRKLATPEAANARVKAARAVFKFGIADGSANDNPALSVPYFKTGSTGHHTWTPEEIHQFEERHPIGTKPRLALALIMFTGARRSDVAQLGKQHISMAPRKLEDGRVIQDEWLKWQQYKNRDRHPITVEIPLLPSLREILDASPTGDMLFLTAKGKKPYSHTGFSNRFKDWCVEAGLPHCSAHGLRKAAATIAAENGATEWQLMAIFGWTDPKQAARYTLAARRKKLAGSGMALISAEQTDYIEVPLSNSVGQKSQKSQ